MKRILFVNPGLDLGGAEHSLLLLLGTLRDRGFRCSVVLFGEGPFQQRLQTLDFETILLPLPRVVRRGTRYRTSGLQTAAMLAAGVPATLRLAAIIGREAADVVHTNGAKAHLLAGVAGRLAGKPVVWHVRDFPPPASAGRLFARALRRLPNAVIANSMAVAESLRGLGARADHLVVAPNPVDLNRMTPDHDCFSARRALGLDVASPVVGMIAHLTPWKGHEQFLRIARNVRDAVPNAQFIIAGGSIYETDGHDRYLDRLRVLAADLGISNAVNFLGKADNVPTVLAALDVLVHCPSAPEPFGRVLAEAMASGRAVVASRCGGIPEVVSHGQTGFLVEPHDVAGFADSVVRLLADTELRRSMGAAGRVHAEQRFSIGGHADIVESVYQRLDPPLGTAA